MADARQYRFRGSIQPSAQVKRPVRAERPAVSTPDVGVLRLDDVIDSWGGEWGISAKEFIAALEELGDVNEIRLHINSPGGEVYEGITILNALRRHPARVVAVVDGLAASAASFIAAGADELIMGRNTELMAHEAWSLALGPASEMRAVADRLDALSANIASIYAEKSGGPADSWRAVMQKETWFSAEEAVAAGLADSIEQHVSGEESKEPQARFDLGVFRHQGRKSAPSPADNVRDLPSKTPAASAAGSITNQEGSTAVSIDDAQLTTLRQRLSVADDADGATILAALDSALGQPRTAPALPEGHVAVSKNYLDELKLMAEAGQQARAQQLQEARDKAISNAIAQGKIAPARRDHWVKSWDKDPEGTKADLDDLPANRLVPLNEIGYAADKPADPADSDNYWFAGTARVEG